MSRWLQIGAILIAGIVVAIAIATQLGAFVWDRATHGAVHRLGRGPAPARPGAEEESPARFSPEQLAGLPAPVVRYFEYALISGQRMVRRARFRQTGEFSMRPNVWNPFTAVEHFSVHPAGFLWDARIRMAPLISMRVHDGYVDGQGVMQAKLAGLVSVADQRGTPAMASGELLRYLAEVVWLPTALLPSEGVVWSAIDDTTARATLTDRGTTVTLDIHFGGQGEIEQASASRYRDVKGVAVLTPCVCHYRAYQRTQGMMIPTMGDVEWVLMEDRLPYWRGWTVGVEYDFGP
jgi:hypothetical protein